MSIVDKAAFTLAMCAPFLPFTYYCQNYTFKYKQDSGKETRDCT